jgi:hypothetical protein
MEGIDTIHASQNDQDERGSWSPRLLGNRDRQASGAPKELLFCEGVNINAGHWSLLIPSSCGLMSRIEQDIYPAPGRGIRRLQAPKSVLGTPQTDPCRSQCFLWRVFEAAATAHIVLDRSYLGFGPPGLDSGLHVITHRGFSSFR